MRRLGRLRSLWSLWSMRSRMLWGSRWMWPSCVLFLVPVIWQVEMYIDIAAIKVVRSVERKADIFTNLPSHVIFITFS